MDRPIYTHGSCQDVNLSSNVRERLLLQEATKDHFLSNCSEAWPLCGQPPDTGYSSTLVRLYCPRTCGCAGPAQFFAGSGEGCPRSCALEFEDALATSQQCEDRTPEELREDPMWLSYTSSVVMYLHQKGRPETIMLANSINLTAMKIGCRALTEIPEVARRRRWDFCSPAMTRGSLHGSEHRTVRAFCPESCECAIACGKDPSCKDCPANCGPEAIAT